MRAATPFVAGAALLLWTLGPVSTANAQERLPWESPAQSERYNDGDVGRYANRSDGRVPDAYSPGRPYSRPAEPPPRRAEPYAPSYGDPPPRRYQEEPPRRYQEETPRRYQEPPPRYSGPDRAPRYDERYSRPPAEDPRHARPAPYPNERTTYSESEIVDAGHRFFGRLSKGLAQAIEYAFRSQGRPTGYILGEDAGGAFIAGLRYGEGRLYTKYGTNRKIYWQGPSVGYDFGGEGSRTMVLVYNLHRPGLIFRRYGGVQGSAYVVGGASVQLLKAGKVTLAPIRTGVGLRLGANVGYLKYTRRPTWNPF